MRRVILLGASNLTYGFPLVAHSLRATFAEAHLLAAHGHGRSYGNWSRVLTRRLPGIRNCGLWDALSAEPNSAQTSSDERPLALITDVGNDLLYGIAPATILSWVDECLQRLRAMDAAVTITGLPIVSVKRMSGPRYHATRMCFFPSKGPRWGPMQQMIDELDAGLRELSTSHKTAFIEPKREWYGLDPIHVRQRQRIPAWREILAAWPIPQPTMAKPSLQQAMRLWRLKSALREINGSPQTTAQPVVDDADGMSISLY